MRGKEAIWIFNVRPDFQATHNESLAIGPVSVMEAGELSQVSYYSPDIARLWHEILTSAGHNAESSRRSDQEGKVSGRRGAGDNSREAWLSEQDPLAMRRRTLPCRRKHDSKMATQGHGGTLPRLGEGPTIPSILGSPGPCVHTNAAAVSGQGSGRSQVYRRLATDGEGYFSATRSSWPNRQSAKDSQNCRRAVRERFTKSPETKETRPNALRIGQSEATTRLPHGC